jgi:hypothetical protein
MPFRYHPSLTKKAVGIAVGVAAILGTSGVALAATGNLPGSASATIGGCVTGKSRTLENVHTPASGVGHCSSGFGVSWNVQGQKGATGARGPQGAPGPSGVVSVTTKSLVTSPPMNVVTGGSFTTNKTLVGKDKLAAGTYLINVNFMATPNAVTTGAVFPQVFVYDGAQQPSFANDLFNVGSGALEQATQSELSEDPINSYDSGSTEITVPAGGEYLYLYAFGYDSDQGAGSYNLNVLSVTATQLNVTK